MSFNYTVLGGITDFSVVIRIVDSADGTPETGVVFNTTGIDLQYRRELAASTAITEATLAALTTAHADGGFLHIGNGYYRLDLPDAAVAAGVKGCLVHGIVTGMVVIGCYIEIVGYDPTLALATPTNITAGTIATATNVTTVNGLAANVITSTAINNDAFTAAKFASDVTTEFQAGLATPTNITAGIITTVTNLTNAPTNGDLTATMKTSVTTAATAATPVAASVTGAVGSVTGNVGGNVVGSVASVTGNVGGNVNGTVATLTTYTGNTVQTGDSFARIGAAGAGLTAADDAVIAAIAALNNIASGAAMTLTSAERNAIADALGARTLGTESYAVDGVVPTFAQAFFMIMSMLGDFSIAGTTLTAKKLDGSTTSMTFTLDDAVTPTSRTRAT